MKAKQPLTRMDRNKKKTASIKPKHVRWAARLFGDFLEEKERRSAERARQKAAKLGFETVNHYKSASEQDLLLDAKKFYKLRAARLQEKEERQRQLNAMRMEKGKRSTKVEQATMQARRLGLANPNEVEELRARRAGFNNLSQQKVARNQLKYVHEIQAFKSLGFTLKQAIQMANARNPTGSRKHFPKKARANALKLLERIERTETRTALRKKSGPGGI